MRRTSDSITGFETLRRARSSGSGSSARDRAISRPVESVPIFRRARSAAAHGALALCFAWSHALWLPLHEASYGHAGVPDFALHAHHSRATASDPGEHGHAHGHAHAHPGDGLDPESRRSSPDGVPLRVQAPVPASSYTHRHGGPDQTVPGQVDRVPSTPCGLGPKAPLFESPSAVALRSPLSFHDPPPPPSRSPASARGPPVAQYTI